jgi:diguanylate cyclase (GGDEF)-like protein
MPDQQYNNRMLRKEPSLYGLFNWVEKLPVPVALTGGFLLALTIGWIDFLTGFEVSLSYFYLIPISVATWARGERAGLVTTALCAVISLLASLLGRPPFQSNLVIIWNVAIRSAIFLQVTLLIATLREHWVEARQLARTDFLTGALNNRAFYEVIHAELDRARRYRRPLAIAYIDLDNFKQVNDEFGHSIGDAVLRTVARTILANIRKVDVLARIGGDEFAVLMPETGLESQEMLRRLHGLVTEELRRGMWNTTVSMGAAAFLTPPHEVDDVLRMADNAMYKVKRSTKDGLEFRIYEEEAERKR